MSLYDLVSGQLETCQKYAEDALEQANDYLDSLAEVVDDPYDPFTTISYDWPEPALDWNEGIRPVRPEGLDLPERDEPADITLVDITIPTFPEIPAFSETQPVISYPDKPSTELPDAPTDSPAIRDIDIPALPSYTLPEVPVFSGVTLPGVPEIIFPTFEAEPPTADLTPPEVGFIYSEALYESELGDALKAKILSGIQNGGTGLSAEVENAIWNQAKLRTESENERLYTEALNFWSARGWSIPPGALDGRLYEISTESSRALADINEKILIEQARLAQEMEKFITTSGLQMEKMTMDYSNAVQQRAFEAAKATVEFAVAVFAARVQYYNAQMEAYKTFAFVYEARIKAELGKVEVFKVQLEASKLQIDINQAEVQLYLAQLQGVNAIIEIYKSQMQAASLQADINKLQLQMFGLQVETYKVQVQAKVSEFDLYKAEMVGEQLKVQTYAELVRAYATRVEGLKAEIDGKRSEIEAKASVNKNLIDVLLARTERYKALLGADVEKVKTIATVYDTEGRLYTADIQAAATELGAQVDVYKGRLTRARNETDIMLKQADMSLQVFVQNRQLAIEAAKAGANVCAQLAASALSAVHAGANIGYSGSEQFGVAESKSTSSSTQTVYQHVYNES